ncbi:hypothetical protein J0B03_11150 [Alkalibacter rhizosphaerae]|uniref:V-type ATP synthase subunit E n=1 Tax=Alkalibacter rhizosphaerae TaxID=2815577 RepID=A0A974XGR1_9FIRM|nr:hypothetical protein [Alkalibacter rhizosphaerae]QSX08330.1 hypothetical protein J0B03_11150 [Alkalibacter rhizosphaerae]
MITVEDKIRTFSKYVYEKEVKQKDEALQKEKVKQEQIREEAKSRILGKNEIQLAKQKKKLDLEAQRIISSAKSEARNINHQIKAGIQKDLKDSMEQAVVAYIQSAEYEVWMKKQLTEVLLDSKGTKAVVALIADDIPRFQSFLKDGFPLVVVETLDAEALGGALVEFPEAGTRMDFTLKSKLEEMENESGLELNEVLDEAVKAND